MHINVEYMQHHVVVCISDNITPPPSFPLPRPAKGVDMTNIGTILLMLVCEDDSDDILGISVIHGMEIPQLYAHIESLTQENVPERKKLALTLFMQKESPVQKEMQARVEAHDQEIIEFCKSNRRLFEKSQRRGPGSNSISGSVTKWLSQLN